MFSYKYPRPSLTTDALLLCYDAEKKQLQILLIQRKNEPFKDKWALPGGFIDMSETAEECAARELYEETNLQNIRLEQLITASKIDRDPRGRTISVVFWSLVGKNIFAKAADDASDVKWFSIENLPELAFDHSEIIHIALQKLKLYLKNPDDYKEFLSEIINNSYFSEFKEVVKML